MISELEDEHVVRERIQLFDMHASHPFPQLIPGRVAAALRRLEERIWRDAEPLIVEATAPGAEHLTLAEARSRPRIPVIPGEAWGRLFDQRWCRVSCPALAESAYLYWNDDGEATLWIGDEPHYGLDIAHRRAPLPKGTEEVWIESYCCQSAIWHPEARGLGPRGSMFSGATLQRRDDEAWAAYHDLKCLHDLSLAEWPGFARPTVFGFQPALTGVPVLLRRLLRALNEAINAFDVDGVPALRQSLKWAYEELREREPMVRAVLTGHAHIDLVWLWPERMGEAKAVHTFATVNRLMESYPEFRFAYSQPASYAAVGRRAPTLAAAVQVRVRRGQWEPTGALYVESDTLLPCGEALARSFAIGQAAFAELRGAPSRLAWLPDVFGYSGCLPQLMKLAGVEYFFTTKLTWSAITRFPFSSFVWRGTDGSEVLAHVTQETGYNATLTLRELCAAAEAHVQADIHHEFLQPTGYGDGGGGPTEEMCERARRFASLRGVPAVTWDQPEAFFDRMSARRDALPTYQGECYLEYHRGTYTTQAQVKAAYRALERALQLREAVIVATGTSDVPEDLDLAWRRLVFAQFHDCLPGTSIPDVYAEIVPELRSLAVAAEGAAQARLERPNESRCACVFNPLPVPQTLVRRGNIFEIPPLCGKAWTDLLPRPTSPVVVADGILANERVAASIDAQGNLTALSVDGRPVAFSGPAAQLITYADNPAAYDAWDIDRHTLALAKPVTTVPTIRYDSHGVVVSRTIGQASSVDLRFWLEPGSSVLRISVRLQWREPQLLLKLHFPTLYQSEPVRCGSPFGSVLRSQTPGATHAEAMWEMPISRYVSVGDSGEHDGLFVVTEAKYGASCRGGDLAITLVRSPSLVGYESHRTAYPAGLSRHAVDSIYSDQGAHVIELAVGRLRPDMPLSERPAALADLLFTPVLEYRGVPVVSCLRGVASESLWPCWAKPEGDGAWTLRLHEVLGRRGEARIELAEGWTAVPVDLLGRATGAPLIGGRLEYRPHEIISVRLGRASNSGDGPQARE